MRGGRGESLHHNIIPTIPSMTIRPATPEDVPHVLPMVRRIAAFHEAADPAKYSFRADPGDMYRGWLTKRATDPRSAFFVAVVRSTSAKRSTIRGAPRISARVSASSRVSVSRVSAASGSRCS